MDSQQRTRRIAAVAASIAALILIVGPISSALAMKSNVDSPLNLMMNGTKVDAHGPISWDADETSGTFTISITQGSVSGTRSATYAPSSSSWHMTVTAAAGGHFHSGAATGTGSAVVNLAGGGTETYTWTVPITLN